MLRIMVIAIAFVKIDCWGDRLDIMNYGDGDRLFVIFSIKFNNVFSGNE
ncbi:MULTISPECIES: hypothetical protein [Pseudanabaena]|nr:MULTISPECIES: hypothetical protein [Pseudanabaena]MEA5489977.1 hypothetical protein [Pseudanabaena sp. CCNP1317]WGS74987.1 hypothetical protein OA858_23620 [Pseudanabaena galeata CCNP1313]